MATKDKLVTLEDLNELKKHNDSEVTDLKSDLNYNHTAEPGYVLRATNDGRGNEWAMVGTPTDAQAEEAINNWLDDHPEATTTVQDGSLTVAKFTDALKLSTVKDYITPEMFGAKGDGITDDSEAIQSAINHATENSLLLYATKSYKISSTIVVTCDAYIEGYLISSSQSVAVQIGNGTNALLRKKIYIGQLVSSVLPNNATGVLVANARNIEVTFNYIDGFYNAVVIYAENTGTAYNKFYINYLYRYKNGLTLKNAGTGYVNENQFFCGRIAPYTTYDEPIGILITGDDIIETAGKNSANKFYSPCLELNHTCAKINNGTKNIIYDARVEGSTYTMICTDKSHYNIMYGLGGTVTDAQLSAGNIFVSLDNRLLENYKLIGTTGSLYNKCANTRYSSRDYGSAPNVCLYTPTVGIKTDIRGANVTDGVLNLIINSAIGFYVDTSESTEFILSKKASSALAVVVIQFDSNGDIIDEAPIGTNDNYPYAKRSGAGDIDCEFYAMPANNKVANPVSLSANCKSAFIGIRATADVTLYELELLANGYAFLKYYSDHPKLSQAPTSTGIDGQIIMNSSPSASGIGWIWYNNAWNSF